jgi:hypothetical protein
MTNSKMVVIIFFDGFVTFVSNDGPFTSVFFSIMVS